MNLVDIFVIEKIAALQVSGKENTEQVQCSDLEEAFHEQSQQGSSFSFQARRVYDRQSSIFSCLDQSLVLIIY